MSFDQIKQSMCMPIWNISLHSGIGIRGHEVLSESSSTDNHL